ncbi:ABC transporter substrate-binding protein [Nocardia sp. 348MFTsu5.1]|uniref:ABC transporter substrate-binding protein n=1 Tax=Nocardia sp. 348MFTsu5.1 TaxID=1172185 RepID=UPI000377450C|nr:ABC transporter substrate-binding protein [Nocardia sp. 348MFTsu5.1]
MKKLRGLRAAQVMAASIAVIALASTAACSSDDSSDDSSNSSSAVEAPEGSYPGVAATGDPVKIGLINNEGGQAISQPASREAAEAVVKYANENLGGIGGRPIELVICKEAEEPASARDCANQMVEAKVSAAVITSTGLGDVMVPTITGAGIPYITASGQSTSELTNPGSFLWTGGFPASLNAMASYAGEKGMKNVTAFTINVPAAVNGLEKLGIPAFKAQGVDLKVVPIPLGTPDATPQVSAGLASNPEGVIVVGEETACTSVFKALGTLGSTAEKFTNASCTADSVVQAVGSSIEGAHVFAAYDATSDTPEANLFKSIMEKYSPSTETGGQTPVAYQGMLGLIRATESVQGTDTSAAAIIAAIKAAKDVPVPAAEGLTFTCNGTALPPLTSICGKGSIVLTIKDGQPTDPQTVGS